MGEAEQIIPGVYLVAGPNISHAEDATSFVIDFGDQLVMIDSGLGRSVPVILDNIRSAGLDPKQISTLILTHCHIDHIGGAREIQEQTGCRIAVHELDAEAVETGDSAKTAAGWYGTKLSPLTVDHRLSGSLESLSFGKETLHCLHTPGHTPGSISLYLDRGGGGYSSARTFTVPFTRLSAPMWRCGRNPCKSCWIWRRTYSAKGTSGSSGRKTW